MAVRHRRVVVVVARSFLSNHRHEFGYLFFLSLDCLIGDSVAALKTQEELGNVGLMMVKHISDDTTAHVTEDIVRKKIKW